MGYRYNPSKAFLDGLSYKPPSDYVPSSESPKSRPPLKLGGGAGPEARPVNSTNAPIPTGSAGSYGSGANTGLQLQPKAAAAPPQWEFAEPPPKQKVKLGLNLPLAPETTPEPATAPNTQPSSRYDPWKPNPQTSDWKPKGNPVTSPKTLNANPLARTNPVSNAAASSPVKQPASFGTMGNYQGQPVPNAIPTASASAKPSAMPAGLGGRFPASAVGPVAAAAAAAAAIATGAPAAAAVGAAAGGLAGGAVGAALGAMGGPVGSAVGAAVGSGLGSALGGALGNLLFPPAADPTMNPTVSPFPFPTPTIEQPPEGVAGDGYYRITIKQDAKTPDGKWAPTNDFQAGGAYGSQLGQVVAYRTHLRSNPRAKSFSASRISPLSCRK